MRILKRERTIAEPGFNRWLVPPAALCIHLCIGMAYGFSVFWLPMTKAIGIDHSVLAPTDMPWWRMLVTNQYDWDKPILGWIYTLFFVFLGGSAACFGRWLEEVGPRAAGFAAACCWSGGLLVAALGVYVHQLWLVWLGAGVIGGIGLGLGYISPVSTLIKWFPDRRGMATGLAIMGFGGGAMIGSPLADRLMQRFANDHSVGVWETFVVMAVVYFVYMLLGAFAYRIPPADWRPSGWQPPTDSANQSKRYVHVRDAWRTQTFWLLWLVLCLNVSAGIGLLGMASPLLQEIFGGRLIGSSLAFKQLSQEQLKQVASVAAGFIGLLSLFNIVGRFLWASLSDYLGRKVTYGLFFLIGCFAYASIPWLGQLGSILLFVAVFCLIMTMYGGGFASIPAYLADQFGTQMVGAIHGRLLTAWSVAGVFGPVLVNYWNAYQIRQGVPQERAYDQTMYILAGLLIVGFICNVLIRPVDPALFHDPENEQRNNGMDKGPVSSSDTSLPNPSNMPRSSAIANACLVPFWLLVLIPLGWGAWITMQRAGILFGGSH
ncbi:MAG: OFA family MFS transporter [Planctomycetes bacterium]|nr:OFA family MFS transporter [Planctomycetota bacterium]